MEFTILISLLGSKVKEDWCIAMEYLKHKYPDEIPRGVRSLLYRDVGGTFLQEDYLDMSYSSSEHNFTTWNIKWKENDT